MTGKIIKNISNDYTVSCNDKLYVCKVRGKIRTLDIKPLVGDIVIFDDKNNYILEIKERKNYLNDTYQCIVGTIVPKYNYSNIIIKITNESLQNISIGNVRLFKGKALFYNEYDDNSQIIKTNIENKMTDYEYDSKYRISKVFR